MSGSVFTSQNGSGFWFGFFFFCYFNDISASPYTFIKNFCTLKKKKVPDLFSLSLEELDSHTVLGNYKKDVWTHCFVLSVFLYT